jgi:polyhydroxybutyrate depolymerase
VWSDQQGAERSARRQRIADADFLQALVDQLRRTHVVDDHRICAVGMSNGGLLAEHLARHGLLDLQGIVLTASSTTLVSRQACPVPRESSRVLMFHGTSDPVVPYRGGPIGHFGPRAQRRNVGRGGSGVSRSVAPVEDVAADWAAVDGAGRAPFVEPLPVPTGALGVTRLSWFTNDVARVILYRVEGGGHTWPGGAQYLPERFIGPVARDLDATGILMEFLSGC